MSDVPQTDTTPSDQATAPTPAAADAPPPAPETTEPPAQPQGQPQAQPQGQTQADVVELAIPARTAYVSVLRSTAAALAARLDFTIDEIEDLRIAVDEASALLLSQASASSSLACQFRLAGDELIVRVSARSNHPRLPASDSFAWTVLTALAGPVDAEVDEAGRRTTLTLTKRAEAVRESARRMAGDVHDLDAIRRTRDDDGVPPNGRSDSASS